ncbi:MAG TPA: protein-L-isoaspartate(D-aspartate) O-methyltransferase [Planctomycetaceae bacterium]|jgi:protein-L-isoaspartate(D-aspartate) O-methyltransferase|nr:protein-L-isoaspartate(D-aspartate) O-methyltransferase [Planctomycetaceae bacterium]
MTDELARHQLIEELIERGITDRRVLDAMAEIPRERFVLEEYHRRAYDDRALPIDAGQTISQPYMVALMTQELRLSGDECVLEIGTGSGYQAAILAKLCRRVVTIERIAELSAKARTVLDSLGIRDVECHVGDGSLGWPADAPYDGIIVTAGAPEMPQELYAQLRPEGRLVIPIGAEHPQMLQTIIKRDGGPLVIDVCECTFVPLIGEEGWPNDDR